MNKNTSYRKKAADHAKKAYSSLPKNTQKTVAGILTVIAVILIAGAWLWQMFFSTPQTFPTENVEFYFFDVGQGDAAAIITSDACILIDAGTNESEDRLELMMNKAGIKTIDLAIFTHSHEDHIGGADMVIKNFNVKKILMSDAADTTVTYKRLMNSIEKSRAELTYAKRNSVIEIKGIKLTVLAAEFDAKNKNNNSIVILAEWGKNKVIYTGDAEATVEKSILEAYSPWTLNCNILKVGHHGSTTSNSKNWLSATMPDIAVISCGIGNDYGHPHVEIIDRLNDIRAAIHRTDYEGTLVFTGDGNTITFGKKK